MLYSYTFFAFLIASLVRSIRSHHGFQPYLCVVVFDYFHYERERVRDARKIFFQTLRTTSRDASDCEYVTTSAAVHIFVFKVLSSRLIFFPHYPPPNEQVFLSPFDPPRRALVFALRTCVLELVSDTVIFVALEGHVHITKLHTLSVPLFTTSLHCSFRTLFTTCFCCRFSSTSFL